MCKRYTKLSKLLTNIHAGFVTALLGCVLTFAPLNAMATPYFTSSSGNCSTYAGRPASSTHWGGVVTETTGVNPLYFYKTGTTTYYYINDLSTTTSCSTGYVMTTDVIDVSSLCGTGITVTRHKGCASCTATSDTTSCSSESFSNYLSNCSSYTTQCVGGKKVRTCSICKSGWSKVTKSANVNGCTYSYSDCTKCTTDAACGGTVDNETTAYIHTTTNICNGGTCVTSYSCKCNTGYYGSNLTAASSYCSGCTACPTDSKSGVAGSSAVGSDEIGDCYIASGKPFTDDKGSGTYSGVCSY